MNPLPVRPETICEYMQFKYLPAGTPVCMYQSSVPIFFRTDEDKWDELLSTGDWKAPTCLAKFPAALKSLHQLYPHLRTGYYPVCSECVRANADMTDSSGYRSCLNHAGRPQILESGNPTESTEFLDEEMIAARKMAGQVITSAIQLLPHDIRDLRNAYVGKDLHNFQIFVMILLGIKLFLRSYFFPLPWNNSIRSFLS
jgi:hypothetical protein